MIKIILLTLYLTYSVYAEDKYEIPEDFDTSELLKNDRLLTAYIKCLIDQGPCTPEGKRVKDTLPEALETKCAKCTDKQKDVGATIAQHIKNNYADLWKQLAAKYDPKGKHQDAFKDYFKA